MADTPENNMTRVMLYDILEKPNKVCKCYTCMDGLAKFFMSYMSRCSVYTPKARASIIQSYRTAYPLHGHRLFNAFCHSMLEENELYNFFEPTLALEVARECFCSYMVWRLSVMRDFGHASDIP